MALSLFLMLGIRSSAEDIVEYLVSATFGPSVKSDNFSSFVVCQHTLLVVSCHVSVKLAKSVHFLYPLGLDRYQWNQQVSNPVLTSNIKGYTSTKFGSIPSHVTSFLTLNIPKIYLCCFRPFVITFQCRVRYISSKYFGLHSPFQPLSNDGQSQTLSSNWFGSLLLAL